MALGLPRVPRASGHAAAPPEAMPPDASPEDLFPEDLLPPGGVEEHRFPCTTCGADMRFDPSTGGMRCDNCGNEAPLPGVTARARALALGETDLRRGLAGLRPEEVETTHVSECPSCGARFELDPAVKASECPFCATPVVAEAGLDRHIKPQAVLPFSVTERDARGSLRTWLRGLWFAPNALKKYAREDSRLAGIYAPHWTFDAETMTRYTGQRGIRRTETYRNAKGETQTRSRIDWYPARGRVRVPFDDLVVLGSASLPEALTDGVEPWPIPDMRPYAPQIVAGFRAEAYTVGLASAWERAQQKMVPAIRHAIKRDIGGDAQRILQMETATAEERFRHVLFPLWVAAYRYGGKGYRFVVNGRTGKVAGERPYSAWKIFFAVLAALIVAGGLYLLSEGGLSTDGFDIDLGGRDEPAPPRPAPPPGGTLTEDDLRPLPLPD